MRVKNNSKQFEKNKVEKSWVNWNKELKKKKLTQTLEETYNLFLKGFKIKEISIKRDFNEETIERQIIELITKSMINIDDIVIKKNKDKILRVIQNLNLFKLSEIKKELPEEINWFEIKCVLAYINSLPNKLEKR